jgi:hypothetical protein
MGNGEYPFKALKIAGNNPKLVRIEIVSPCFPSRSFPQEKEGGTFWIGSG